MDSQLYLYKVSPPRADMTFMPSRFWRSHDWESSSTRPKEGYVEDVVLYVGDFDEVTIHLFPRVRTVRVRAVDADATRLNELGLNVGGGTATCIFADRSRRQEIDAFRPTIYTFDRRGFTNVRRGEYVSRQPRTAIASQTLAMSDALARWDIEARYVDNLDTVIDTLRKAAIYFDEQT